MPSSLAPRLDIASVPVPNEANRWRVRLFGSFRLVGPDGSTATPSGRKARALIAYLVLAEGDTVPRERLASLLWSERGDDQARASMRQTFYEMRALTSGDGAPIHVGRQGARAVVERLTSDLQALRSASKSADLHALTALLGDRRPDLLVDLDGLDPAFDEWLATERVRCDHERRRVALAAVEHALALQNAAGADRIARHLLSCDATDEAAARLAMEASHRLGDRDAVRQTFRQVREALRDEHAAKPADETVASYERLMMAEMPLRAVLDPVSTTAANEDASPEERTESPGSATPSPSVGIATARAVVRRRAAFAVLCAIAVGGATAYVLRPFGQASAIRTLAVEPLRAAATDSAALALRVGLSADLARLIVGNDNTLRVVDAPQPAAGDGSDTFRVDGEASSEAGLVHATLRLLHDANGPILWSRTFVRPVGEIEALREEMASKLGDVSICALGHTNPKASEFSPEAMRLMLGACDQKHVFNTDEVAKLLEQLLALRPDYAHGWAMLAVSRQFSALDRPADAAALEAESERDAERALALDPNDGEAFYARALRLGRIDQWSDQMAILERGQLLDPANAQIDNVIGGDLVQVGRWQEAEAFYRRAVEADPFGVFKLADHVRVLGFGGDPAAAMVELLKGRKRFGNHRAIALADFEFNGLLGDPRRAQAILDDQGRGFVLPPDRMALWKSLIADRIAPTRENVARADTALHDAMQASRGNATLIVEALAWQGRVDEAYGFLDRITPTLRDDLQTEALFNVLTRSLRDDPRFMTVAARAGLVPIWEQTGHWPDYCAAPGLKYDCKTEARRAMSPDARPLIAARSIG